MTGLRETAYLVLRTVGLCPGRTTAQLASLLGCHVGTARAWLEAAEEMGLVYCTWVKRPGWAAVWHYNTVPGARASDPRPPKQPAAERKRALRRAKRLAEQTVARARTPLTLVRRSSYFEQQLGDES